MTSFFNPQKLLDKRTRELMPSFCPLVLKVVRLYDGDVQILDNEWRDLDSTPVPPGISPESCNPIDFYVKLGAAKTENTFKKKNHNICLKYFSFTSNEHRYRKIIF